MVVERGFFKPELVKGFGEDEVVAREAADRLHYPAAFREYLLWMGHMRNHLFERTGHQWAGDFEALTNVQLQEEARNLLEINGLAPADLPDDAVVFWYYQGYAFFYFRCGDGDDPPVYEYVEGEAVRQTAGCFSEMVYQLALRAEKELTSRFILALGDLEHLAVPDELLRSLSFNGTIKFEQIPEKVFDFVNLTELDLRHKELGEVDRRIGRLEKLVRLNLGNNQLATLPKTMGALTQLEWLSVAHNRLPADVVARLRAWLPECEIEADHQR